MTYSDELLMTYAKILKRCLIKMQKLKKESLPEDVQNEINMCEDNIYTTISFITKENCFHVGGDIK